MTASTDIDQFVTAIGGAFVVPDVRGAIAERRRHRDGIETSRRNEGRGLRRRPAAPESASV